MPKTDLLQGTLDLLILKILTFGPNHGWGIANRIRQISQRRAQRQPGLSLPGAAPSRIAG
jgi:PadR family transcriptional regulator